MRVPFSKILNKVALRQGFVIAKRILNLQQSTCLTNIPRKMASYSTVERGVFNTMDYRIYFSEYVVFAHNLEPHLTYTTLS